jgi:dihydroorotase
VDERLILGTMAYLGARTDGLQVPVEHVKTLLANDGLLSVQLSDVAHSEGSIARDLLDSARNAPASMHLMHLSTAQELDLLDPVRGQVPVTAGVTPHHLFLSSESEPSPVTTFPPVRDEHDRKTLWTAMKRGRVDCLASDHVPSVYMNGTTEGMPSAELLFPLMLSAVKYGRLSLELLANLCAESPARIFGLENKGRIEKGADADLVLFTEGELTRVSSKNLLSGAGWSPYLEREAAPKPELVMVGGEIVARKGELVGSRPSGRHLLAD